ncbi:hypothetical protein NLG97_g1384 [Lecanicillium saksenae]|uniref:Uncharacterized protein n=1 Tax=Lecanicillium saksenae TaxID=468837 RepID=A0ACC1R6J7_9HYPO|nr:hypothetical protein NLG97_g1384 [Lecanicillium saksenae]
MVTEGSLVSRPAVGVSVSCAVEAGVLVEGLGELAVVEGVVEVRPVEVVLVITRVLLVVVAVDEVGITIGFGEVEEELDSDRVVLVGLTGLLGIVELCTKLPEVGEATLDESIVEEMLSVGTDAWLVVEAVGVVAVEVGSSEVAGLVLDGEAGTLTVEVPLELTDVSIEEEPELGTTLVPVAEVGGTESVVEVVWKGDEVNAEDFRVDVAEVVSVWLGMGFGLGSMDVDKVTGLEVDTVEEETWLDVESETALVEGDATTEVAGMVVGGDVVVGDVSTEVDGLDTGTEGFSIEVSGVDCVLSEGAEDVVCVGDGGRGGSDVDTVGLGAAPLDGPSMGITVSFVMGVCAGDWPEGMSEFGMEMVVEESVSKIGRGVEAEGSLSELTRAAALAFFLVEVCAITYPEGSPAEDTGSERGSLLSC